MAEIAYFRIPPSSDPESTPLRSVLAEHLRREELTSRRQLLTSLLALLSAPVWAMAIWPRLLEGPDRRFLLYLFGVLLAMSLWAVVEEWRAARLLQRSIEGVTSAAEGPELTAGAGCELSRSASRLSARALPGEAHP